GIPMVYAVVGGQPVDAFTGVVPENQLRQWIDAILRTAGVDVAVPEDPRMTAADDAMMGGDLDAAEQAYKKILAESPADASAEAGLAQVSLLRRTSGIDPRAALAKADANPDDVPAQPPGALRDPGLVTRVGAHDAGCVTAARYDPGDWRPGDGVAHADEIAAYSLRLADRIGALLDAGDFPVVLGGDCSVLLGAAVA